jgi:hypothetical protein
MSLFAGCDVEASSVIISASTAYHLFIIIFSLLKVCSVLYEGRAVGHDFGVQCPSASTKLF